MKYIISIAIIIIIGLGITVSVQRCEIKKQKKDIKKLKIQVDNLKLQIQFSKWYNETVEFLNEIKEKEINKINQSNNDELVNIANKYFKFGLHKNGLQNKTDEVNNTSATKVRKNR